MLFCGGKASQSSPELADMTSLSNSLSGIPGGPPHIPTSCMDLGKGDSNSGSHIYTTGSLTPEPSPSPERFSKLRLPLTLRLSSDMSASFSASQRPSKRAGAAQCLGPLCVVTVSANSKAGQDPGSRSTESLWHSGVRSTGPRPPLSKPLHTVSASQLLPEASGWK